MDRNAGHLGDDTVIALVSHRLAITDRKRAEAHVASCAACRRLVSAAVRGEVVTPAPRQPVDTPTGTGARAPRTSVRRLISHGLPVGELFGRYGIEREIGVGGMGRVYAAFDPALERRVALKLLHDLGDDTSARLLREARAMARLVHPNVVTVYEIGRVDGRDYVAMELVDGETLDEWRRRASRSRREILEAFAKAGSALAAAHAAGLVHRDFKPHNVLRRFDGRIVVTDFGLARTMAEMAEIAEGADTSGPIASLERLTAADQVHGTPAYMAPEQWCGDPVSPATDQFAFCVALWEALAGARPFGGATAEEIRDAVARGPDLLERARLSRGIARVLRRGLRVDPAQRWPSVESLLAALRRTTRRVRVALALASAAAIVAIAAAWPRTDAAQVCAAQAVERVDAMWSPERRAAIRAALGADAGTTAALRWLYTERALDRYAREWTIAAQDRCTAPGQPVEGASAVADCLDRRLHELDATIAILATPDPTVANHAIETAEGMKRPETCTSIAARDAPQPTDAVTRANASALRRAGEAAIVLARAGRAHDAVAQLIPIEAQARRLGFRAVVAEIQLTLGKLRRAIDGPDAAEPVFRNAALNAEAGRHDEVAAEAWIQLMHVAVQYRHDRERARDYGEHADAALERLGRPLALDGLYLVNRGTIAWELESDPKAALELLDQARARLERGAPKEVFRALAAMASIYERTGEPERALALEQRILARSIDELGVDHPGLAGDYMSVAIALAYLQRFDEATVAGEHGVALREIASGPASYDLAMSLYNLGGIYVLSARQRPTRLADAMRTLERAQEISTKVNGDDDPLTLQISLALADAYGERDEPRRAAALYVALLPKLERARIADKSLASARRNYARILLALGRFADSYELSRRAATYYERVADGKPTIDLGTCLVNMAIADGRGQPAAAAAISMRALDMLRNAHATPEAVAQAASVLDGARKAAVQ